MNLSPKPVISRLQNTHIVRDDLLPGGTKQRACLPFIRDLMARGHSRFTYASPFCGFAQIALAYVCQQLEVECTIIAERDKRVSELRAHPFTLRAQGYGAKIILVESLEDAEAMSASTDAYKIPLGFDCPEFKSHLAEAIHTAFIDIEKDCGKVRKLWMPIGSGTLARTFLTTLPERIKLHCVDVRILDEHDPRITSLRNHPRCTYYAAPMSFHSEAIDRPAIPSNIFYDAKIWSFIKAHGTPGDLWWNVAQ